MAARRTAAGSGGDTESSPFDAFVPLDELMPWSVRPLRTGRAWVSGPDPVALRARWERLAGADAAEQERLFAPTRSRTPHTSVAALPGQSAGTARFARDPGPCPDPVRILHGPYDEQWLLPDHRLIDAARPELWRVADGQQLFAVEHGSSPEDAGPALSVTALLPDGYSPAGRPGRIRPLHRRPGGMEPNLAPGLLDLLRGRLGSGAEPDAFTPEAVLAWVLAAARPFATGALVPLPADAELWSRGVALGRELLRLQSRGARGGERPRLPGGRRPYVRAALPARPTGLSYDAGEEALIVGDGRISPVPAEAWEFTVGGVRVLELWFGRRAAAAAGRGPDGTAADGLDAVGARGWPREWTSELLELITVLALLDGTAGPRKELTASLEAGPLIGPAELRASGVLPVPPSARRPASVLGHLEEGPEGQFALL
ncbi:type ISP restriction/modification enzyme [Streptomyces sp. NE06-03C]|uniref:type ISP restriction/modification enzyme n=1 Tax=unclassified Streptomyces TaxID=2593676 RepID=UPI0029A46CFE|nr:type ISP restriction/modification enzyme [Streptomyces sp. NE06-03C]MDX2921363.1 DNA methyltransferase [Streptomyces sp. NE06-03C]